MLAGPVHAGERLFVKEADHSVPHGDAAQDVHRQHVVVDRQVQLFEDRRDFELGGRDFVMARLRGNPEPPQFAVQVGHEREDSGPDRTEVVVFELLMPRRRGTEQGPSGLNQVGPMEVEVPIDQEIFLFRPERDRDRLFVAAERFHQALDASLQNLNRPQERRFLIEHLTGIGAEDGRNTEGRAVGVSFDERGTGRVPSRIAARLERAAQTPRGET